MPWLGGGYRLDVKKAAFCGIPLEGFGLPAPKPHPLAKLGADGAPAILIPTEPMPTCAGIVAVQDFGAGIFRAQLRWALRQPDVRAMLIQILSEHSAHSQN